MIARPTIVLGKVRTSLEVNGWVVTEIVRHWGGRLAVIVGLSLLGVMTRMMAFAVVLIYVTSMSGQGPRPLMRGGAPLSVGNTAGDLALFCTLALGFAVLTAAASYGAEALSFHVARRHVGRAVRRILDAVSDGDRMTVPSHDQDSDQHYLRRLLSRDMMMLLRGTLAILRLLTPLFTFVVAVGWLLWVNVWLTLVVGAVAALYLIPFYRVNRQVVRASRDREERATATAYAVGRLTSFLVDRGPGRGDGRVWSAMFRETGDMDEGLDALQRILLARRKIGALQDLLLGAVLVVLLLLFGVFVADSRVSWTSFLIYIIALRFASGSMSAAATFVTTTNRFLPQISRYRDFCRLNADTPPSPPRADAGDDGPITFEVTGEPVDGSLASLTATPGLRLLCIAARRVDVSTLAAFCRDLTGGDPRRGERMRRTTFFLGRQTSLPPLTIGQLMTGTARVDVADRERIESIIERVGLTSAYRELPDGLETRVTRTVEAAMPPPLVLLTGLMEGILADRRCFIFDAKTLGRITAPARAGLLDVLGDRVVILLDDALPAEPPDGVSYTMLCDSDGLVGIGDRQWHRTQRPPGDRGEGEGVKTPTALASWAEDDLDDL